MGVEKLMVLMDKSLKQITLFELDEQPAGPKFLPTKAGHRTTAKQRAFVRYYLETRELSASAINAGYSPKTAGAIANRLMHKSQVAELIRQEEEEDLRRAGIDRTRALMELAKLAYFDLRQLYREDGSLKNPSEWDDATAAAVASVEVFEEFAGKGKDRKQIGHTKKVKTWDKNRALEMLLKHLGLLKENVVFPDKDGNPMSPGVQIQNRIEVVFVNPPSPDMLRPGNGAEGGD
jgi:phage terminase small subunit